MKVLIAFCVFLIALSVCFHSKPAEPQVGEGKLALATNVAKARVETMKAEIDRIRVDVFHHERVLEGMLKSNVAPARSLQECEYSVAKARADLKLADRRLVEYELLVEYASRTGDIKEPVTR